MELIRRLRHEEDGVTIVFIAVGLFVILTVGALAYDVGAIYAVRADLQKAADNSAQSSVWELPDESEVVNQAMAYGIANHPGHGTVVNAGDVEVGHWDATSETFIAGGTPRNAVRVTARRAAVNGNAVELYLARFMGRQFQDVAATAVAVQEVTASGGNCFNNGVVAGNEVFMGQDIRLNDYCIYGKNGVHSGQDARVNGSSLIGAVDESTITFGQEPRCNGGPIENCLVEDTIDSEIADGVAQLIDDIENGTYTPPGITNVQVVGSLPNTLVDGTAYIVNGTITIGQDYSAQNIIIAARGTGTCDSHSGGIVRWGQDGAIRNTGDPTSEPAVGILATHDIRIGQDATVLGAHLIAGCDVTIGQDLRGFDASIQASRNVYINQDPNFTASFPGIVNPGGGSSIVTARLVG